MKQNTCFLLAAVFFICSSASAQTDSTYLDLGRIKLRKDFTQHITIKGSDLERMPFARLSDAIAPWLQGTLSTRPNLVFVVDGMLINDVNAYSIYDIEEITLVQNALVQVSGSVEKQQVVLITTKRKQEGRRGLTIAGGSFLTNQKFEGFSQDQKSRTHFYHQYYVSAWQNHRNIRYGASANFLRDALPHEKNFTEVHKPRQLSRFRFNGWVDITLAKGHSLSAGVNVVPQTMSHEVSAFGQTTKNYTDARSKQTLINPSLRLTNLIAKGLTHGLDLSYLTDRNPADIVNLRTYYTLQDTTLSEGYLTDLVKNRIFVIRDRVTYTKSLGQWTIEPTVSFMYRSFKRDTRSTAVYFFDGQPAGVYGATSELDAESYVLTPAFSVIYRNSISFGGGLSAKLKKDMQPVDDRIFPFLTATVDLLRLSSPENPYSLKIFGSFVKSGRFTDSYFTLPDLLTDPDPNVMNFIFGPGLTIPSQYPQDRTTNNIQSGMVFTTPGNKLQVSYNFDSRRYPAMFVIPSYGFPTPIYLITYPDFNFTTHRVAVIAHVLNKGPISWTTGLNTTIYKLKMKDEIEDYSWLYSTQRNNGKMSWTGGWTNRVQVKNLSFGLDLLYLLNEYRLRGTPSDWKKNNHVRLNHVYAGYFIKTRGNKPLELYISSRNTLQSDEPNFFDSRRYYGAGFKLLL